MSTSEATAQLPAAARPRRWRSLLTLAGGVLALVVVLDVGDQGAGAAVGLAARQRRRA